MEDPVDKVRLGGPSSSPIRPKLKDWRIVGDLKEGVATCVVCLRETEEMRSISHSSSSIVWIGGSCTGGIWSGGGGGGASKSIGGGGGGRLSVL